MFRQLILIALVATFTACTGGQKTATTATDEATGKTVEYRGEEINGKGAISVDELFVKIADKEEIPAIKVEGEVISVCQVKGCWMRMAAADGQELMVKFKDYGFFMPLDLTGKIVMEGKAFKQVTPVDELRHYAEDAGKSAEEIAAITEPEEEILFEAFGVMIPKN